MENNKIKLLTKVISYLTKLKDREEDRLKIEIYNKAAENFKQFKAMYEGVSYKTWRRVNKKR